MSRVPKDGKFGRPTVPGALYDRHGPIPVADAVESDTDSAWALFEESVMRQDDPQTKRDQLPPDFEETKHDEPDFEPTGFEPTKAAPLKP
jgi:hypothetical protein